MTSFRVRLLSLLLAIPLFGQTLNSTWQTYMITNSSIVELEARRSIYSREQIEIKYEVDQLQKSSEWYNAWINKYLLSGHSKRQLVILDSLRVFDSELERLRTLQESEIRDLKLAYENVLQEYENEGLIPAEQGLRNMQIGRWKRVVDRSSPILFPDYSHFLELKTKKPEQRKIILLDIQRLLQEKIIELDSVKNVRENEDELAHRLASFHEDLGLQMEADQDAQQRDASGNSEKLLGWSTVDAASEFSEDKGGLGVANDRTAETIDLVSINVPREDAREMSLEQRSGRDLNYLKKKLTEYEILLKEINEELDQSP